jgi:hypothetical protein
MPRTPTSRQRPFHRAALATLTGLLVVAGIACGGDDDDGEETGTDPTAETTTTPSTTASLTPEEEAEAAYLELVEVVYTLLTTNPDPDDPDLVRLATDPVLSEFRDSLSTMRAEHHLVERGDQTTQRVLSVAATSANSAVLRACSIGNDRTIDQDDGSVVDEGASASLVDVALNRASGADWQVSDITAVQVFEGQVECPA